MKCTSKLIRASIPVGIALACFTIQPAAQADSRSEKKLVASERVVYADLDLTRASDAQVLLGRIKDAAYRVCGGDPRGHVGYDLMPGRVEFAFRVCRDEAVTRAVATIDMPQLSASSR
jgi:UrcA family protein